jgi:hypothetical protein
MHHKLPQLNSISPRLFAVGIVIFTGACSGSAERWENESSDVGAAQKRQFVLGGTLSDRESVVLVSGKGPNGTTGCTGTLVAPNLVVTARHCVSTSTPGDFSCTINGFIDLSRPRSPAAAGDMGFLFAAEDIAIHAGTVPDFENPTTVGRRVFAPETDTTCRNDVAFVVLEEELSLPYESIRWDEGVSLNEPTTVIGYGLNDNRSVERTERSNVRILAIGLSEFYEVEGNALPRTFVLGTSVCPGDSGGPAISDETGEVLGVFSLFRGACESSEVRNFFTHLAPFKNVAADAFREAGYSELIEPSEPMEEPPEPPAEGGAPPDDDDQDDEGSQRSGDGGGCSFHTGPGPSSAHFLMWSFFVLIIRQLPRLRRQSART